MDKTEARIEKDSMGEVPVPASAYYGAQTARAIRNFPISDARFPRRFIQALGLIKLAAAHVNLDLELLDGRIAVGIASAAQEVVDGKFDDQFVLDIYQTGSGTSTNMNANEVVANRAIELLGGTIGSKKPVGFHQLRTRKAGPDRYLDLHLVVNAAASVEETHTLCDHLEDDLRETLGPCSLSIHVEPCGRECSGCTVTCSARTT